MVLYNTYKSLNVSVNYGKRQGTLKTTVNGERSGESMFAIQCSPCCSPFAALFPIYFFQCSLFKVRYSMFAEPFAIRRAIRLVIRRAVRHSLRRSPFAAPFHIHFPQFSLFKLRYSMFAEPFAIRRAIRCCFSLSPDVFHSK